MTSAWFLTVADAYIISQNLNNGCGEMIKYKLLFSCEQLDK